MDWGLSPNSSIIVWFLRRQTVFSSLNQWKPHLLLHLLILKGFSGIPHYCTCLIQDYGGWLVGILLCIVLTLLFLHCPQFVWSSRYKVIAQCSHSTSSLLKVARSPICHHLLWLQCLSSTTRVPWEIIIVSSLPLRILEIPLDNKNMFVITDWHKYPSF